jgi:hypothetical protein
MLFSIYSPVDIPFVQQEPLLPFDGVHMDILVQAAQTENFVVVLDALAVEEFLRLLQGALHLGDLIILGLEAEHV